MSLFVTIRDGIEYPFEQAFDAIRNVFDSKYLPQLEIFLKLFAADEGKDFLDAAPDFLSTLETAGFAAATVELIRKVLGDDIADAKKDWALATAQSALQIAKVSQNVQTATDKEIITSVTGNA